MSAVLNNIVSFASLGAGAQATAPHGLTDANGIALVPDRATSDQGSLRVIAADASTITVRNDGQAVVTGNVLCEHFHSIMRVLPPGQIALPVQPFVPATTVPTGNGLGVTGQTIITSIWAGGRETHNDNAVPKVVSAFAFSPATHDLVGTVASFAFRAVVANGAAITTHTQLFNVTDNEVVATLDFTSTTQTKVEAALVRGAGAGQIKEAEKVYEARIFLDAQSGGPNDTIELHSAELRVINTVA